MYTLEFGEYVHSMFNEKSKKRRTGINQTVIQLKDYIRSSNNEQPIIWFHCASLGEFHQARPLIEKYRIEENCRIVLSFYSPSGYENCNYHDRVDHVFYLPNDTASNAQYITNIIKAKTVVFSKYEFWFNYLNELSKVGSEFVFISSIFRKAHYLFKFPFRLMSIPILKKAMYLFVQDENSITVGHDNGLERVIQAGDTRIDAVLDNLTLNKEYKSIETFCKGHKVLVIGSSWEEDDKRYLKFIDENKDIKVIIAPHEINRNRTDQLLNVFKDRASLYSEWDSGDKTIQVLIIDSIGMLASLYQYADVVYIGGGFGSGIHNTLEPAVYEVPLIFGPKYEKFEEAKYFIQHQLARSIASSEDFDSAMRWAMDTNTRDMVTIGMKSFFDKNRNSSGYIYDYMKQ